MVVMAAAPFVSMLADLANPLSGLSAAGFASAGFILAIILGIVVGLPLYFIISSFPLWLAAKIAVSGDTTYIVAIKVMICQFLASILMTAVAWGVLIMGAALGGQKGLIVVLVLLFLVSIFVSLSIISNAYGVGLLHAFGLQILTFLLGMVVISVGFFGCSMVVGMAGAMAPLQASYQKLEEARQTGNFAALAPSFSPSEPAPDQPTDSGYAAGDNTAEIDNLLNAALHPTGPAPSLSEREDIVRVLQQKLRTQRTSIPTSDTRAVAVFQNQLNRYLLLLDQVKAERRAHPLNAESGSPQAAR